MGKEGVCCLLLKGTGLKCHQEKPGTREMPVFRPCGPGGSENLATAPLSLEPVLVITVARIAAPPPTDRSLVPRREATPLSFALAPEPPPPQDSSIA